ncbi:hypothetical protein HY793_00735 [Candidatus Desantisbacteria bacterium]|nr:hypothetical protein [Candidatus Desantisbacteria bacterium]
MRKLLFCTVTSILLLRYVAVAYAAEIASLADEKIHAKEQVAATAVRDATPASIPQPRDKSWKNGVAAFGNYDYEQAISCFIESPSPLAKYYLAKIYFGDVPINNLEGASLPEINRQKSIEVLDEIINYKDAQKLKNEYTSLMNFPELLSRFYYERGNYEEAEKAVEHIQGKEAEEAKQGYQSYTTAGEAFSSTSTHSEEAVVSVQSESKMLAEGYVVSGQSESKLPAEEAVTPVQPELKLPPEATTSHDTIDSQSEATFVEEKGRGHDSFSESARFVEGHLHQIGDENDEMIAVDSQSSHAYAKEHCPESVSEEASLPEKGNTLVSIKPAIVWDWPALPGYNYKPVARIEENTKMVLLNDTGNKWYYKVELPDSKIGCICSYRVGKVDKKAKKSVQKTETIEEVSEYINYLVDRHEEKKEAVKPVKKKKKQVAKKSSAKKQPAKSVKAQEAKPSEQQGVVFVDEAPVQRQPATATEHKLPVASEHKPVSAEGHH